jgi:hypothetical protein
MKRIFLASAALTALILTAPGCALRAHVRGLVGSDEYATVPPGARICVAIDPEASESKNADQISNSIELLLSNKGYEPSTSTEAEYFLFFDFERKPLINRIRLEPIGGGRSGISMERKQGPFDLTLALKLVEAGAYHETGTEKFTWVGGAILGSTPTESPKFIDLLLLAGMKYFPEDTEKVVEVKLRLYERKARQLRRLRTGRSPAESP